MDRKLSSVAESPTPKEEGGSAGSSVALRTKLYFGAGAGGEAASMWTFNALLLIFYQQILGLPAGMASIALGIAILADAITDPLIGAISDRFRSRFGRRHPFLFLAPAPLALCVFLIFHPPAFVVDSQTLLFAWLCTFTVLQRTFQTFYVVPHLAMGAELSTDYIERTRIMSFNNLFTLYGGMLMHVMVWFVIFGFFFADQGGQLHRPAYTWTILLACTIILVSIFACAWGTRDQIPILLDNQIEDGKQFSFVSFYSDIWSVLQNRNYLYLLVGLFFLSLTIGTHETLAIFMGTFFWELSPYQIGWLIIGGIIGTHVGFFFAARLHRRFDKRLTISVSAFGLSIFWSMVVNLTLLGLAPANSSWALVGMIIFFSIFSSGFGAVLNISVMSALADIADQQELKTGLRLEGIFYSARAFFSKAMNAVGHVVAGYALEYYVMLPPGSVPGEVSEDVIFRLGVVDGPLAMIGGIIAGFVYFGYRLDKSTHQQIRRLLEARANGSGAS
jgi:GPH family glycoside/pentoside/hexuronide:cation symporter